MCTALENKKIRFPKLVANRTMKNALKPSTLEVELLLARLPKSILLLRTRGSWTFINISLCSSESQMGCQPSKHKLPGEESTAQAEFAALFLSVRVGSKINNSLFIFTVLRITGYFL